VTALLDTTKDLLVVEELTRTAMDRSLQHSLVGLNWALILPTVSDNEVIGAIALGPKLSGDPYYPEDLDLLMTLANQAGIAIKNAQLYAQVVLANEHLENILATITSGVVAVDADGSVTMFNRAAEQLTGIATEQARGLAIAALPSSLGQTVLGTLTDGLARTQPEIELSDGTITRPVMCTTSPLRDPDGALLGAVAVFSDLTPVRQLELERRRAERLAYLETFAAGIAHEVKNPLVAMKTFVQLIPRRREDERFVDEFSRVVSREIGRMERLIGRLRTLSRPGQRPRVVLDVRQPLVDALEFMQAACEDKAIRVEAALGETDVVVLGDGNEIEQLFLNLLMNAHEATPEGGQIGVAVATADGRVSVAVTDSGPGIPEEALGRVFEPFFTTKERGSGLGLAICAGIAETHGARVRAENVSAGGARFTVEFPLASEVSVPVTS
jgi:PAS domain S-box-containing protein